MSKAKYPLFKKLCLVSCVISGTVLSLSSSMAREPSSTVMKYVASGVNNRLPNPYLAFLPAGSQPDYSYWKQVMPKLRAQKLQNFKAPQYSRQSFTGLVSVNDTEPNNSSGSAQAIAGIGTGIGQDPDIEITGTLEGSNVTDLPPITSTEATGSPTDDGNINVANETDLAQDEVVVASGVVGDGAYGSEGTGTGDFDHYALRDLNVGERIVVDIDAMENGSLLDSMAVVVKANGVVVAFNDDTHGRDSFIDYTVTAAGDYFVFISGYPSLQGNRTNSGSGDGAGSEGEYEVRIARIDQAVLPRDNFNFNMKKGDVISAGFTGSGGDIRLYSPTNQLLVGSQQNITSLVPPGSPVEQADANAALVYIAPKTGTYRLLLQTTKFTDAPLSYTANINLYRSPATRQILFLDFNGATVDADALFGATGHSSATLSPLASFLPDWGLAGGKENAVIDAIIAAVKENLKTDLAALSANANFDISIRNSRDHADPFGQPNVSRVIIGGTMDELGLATIGIAESIDPGNFAREETAVVLLDLLSASASNPNSLNGFARAVSKIALIGAGVGNIVAHEAGHIFANFHTYQFNNNASIMDQGGNLANTVGVGSDSIFGTFDDKDVDFTADTYVPSEGFTGKEDTLNLTAFGLSSSP